MMICLTLFCFSLRFEFFSQKAGQVLRGKIYAPCCGSGGMFVHSLKFVQSHHGNTRDISVYGQEYTSTTYKMAKMNLSVRGFSVNLGDVPADTFF